MVKDCDMLGEFDLTGLPPMPRGVPQIEITYDVDANGILNVSAVEKSTGKAEKITIKNDRVRSKEEIEAMVQEASKYEAEDKAQMARVESRNKAEAYLYQARAAVGEDQLKTAIGAESVEKVEALVKEGLEWLESNRDASAEEVEEKQKAWESVIAPIMTAAASASASASASAGAEEPPKAPVVEEVD